MMIRSPGASAFISRFKPRPFRRRAGEGVGEDAGAGRGFELSPLDGQILLVHRYPRIAVNHAAIMRQIYATKKGNDFSGWPLSGNHRSKHLQGFVHLFPEQTSPMSAMGQVFVFRRATV